MTYYHVCYAMQMLDGVNLFEELITVHPMIWKLNNQHVNFSLVSWNHVPDDIAHEYEKIKNITDGKK